MVGISVLSPGTVAMLQMNGSSLRAGQPTKAATSRKALAIAAIFRAKGLFMHMPPMFGQRNK
jgi:hypothetical protein